MPAKQSLVIVLTGATRGLGRAMTEKFIEMGHTVLGCGRNEADVATLGHRFRKPHNFGVVNVADWQSVNSWAAKILQHNGPSDLLVNNAAVMNNNAPLWLVPVEEFDRLIDINVKGVANVLRAFLPAMVQRQTGTIVNFSSGWGRSTAAEVAPYCASKFAIEGLTKALAQELPAGMAAVPLNPGIIDTDMLRTGFGAAAGNYPSPQQWAEMAVPFILKLGPADNGKSLSV